MDAKTRGAWILHHSDKLESVVERADFENIQVAGKAGSLLSALSQHDDISIDRKKVEALAKANNISVKMELPVLLGRLEERNLIKIGNAGIDVLGVSSSEVLAHTAGLFDALGATADENAVIVLAERASAAPLDSAAAARQISDEFTIKNNDAIELVARAADVGFVDSEDIDKQTRLVFNGNLFRRDNAKKMQSVLSSLSADEQRRVNETVETLRRRGCMEQSEVEAILTKPVFDKLQSIGVFDRNTVANSTEEVSFVTHPQAFGKFGDPFVDDALDLAKAFVSCLMYGMSRSHRTRGQITMLTALLGKLIRGGEVGPATAIGEDYRVLEAKGVVSVRTERGGFWMTLLKPDIGQLALKVLTEGDASAEALPNFPSACVSRYERPEQTRRVTRKRMNHTAPKVTRDVLVALRSGSR